MPKYRLSGPDGDTLVIEADRPPTQADAEDIFKARTRTATSRPGMGDAKAADIDYDRPTPPEGGPHEEDSDPGRPAVGDLRASEADQSATSFKDLSADQPLTIRHFSNERPSTTAGGPPISLPEGAAKSIWNQIAEEMSNPRVTLPRAKITNEDSALATVGKEAVNIGASIPEFFTSDAGILTAAVAPAMPVATSGYFTFDMLKSLGEQVVATHKDWEVMSRNQKLTALTDMAGTGVMALLTGKHATEGVLDKAVPARALAKQIREAPLTPAPMSTTALVMGGDRNPLSLDRVAELIRPVAPLTAAAISETAKVEIAPKPQLEVKKPEEKPAPVKTDQLNQEEPKAEKVNQPDATPPVTEESSAGPDSPAERPTEPAAEPADIEPVAFDIDQAQGETLDDDSARWKDISGRDAYAVKRKNKDGDWVFDRYVGGKKLPGVAWDLDQAADDINEHLGAEGGGVVSSKETARRFENAAGEKAYSEDFAAGVKAAEQASRTPDAPLAPEVRRTLNEKEKPTPESPKPKTVTAKTLTPAILVEGNPVTGRAHAEIRDHVRTTMSPDALESAMAKENEGFVDENGNFVSRSDGAKWFKEKTGKEPAKAGELHSEDLRDAGLLSHLEENPSESEPHTEPEPPESTTSFDPAKVQTVEVPVASIKLSQDVPNFKAEASEDTGVVQGEELKGQYERLGTGPIVAWKRLNGDLEVITGRHRLDLARRSGEKTIPAQIVDESKGFTKDMALVFDAESNIRDGQGTVEDYAHYFKNAKISQETAESRGLLARAKGRSGWDLGRNATDDLYAIWKSGKVSEAQAVAIARAAPGNASAQQIGIKFALRGKDTDFLPQVIKAALSESKGSSETLDLFWHDDSALKAMEAQATRAADAQRDIRQQIQSASGASKRPDLAKKLGVDVNDPEGVRKKIDELKAELIRWENWPLHPDLVARTKGIESGTPTTTPKISIAPKVEPPAAPPVAPKPAPKPGGDLFASDDIPFNLQTETAKNLPASKPKPTEPPPGEDLFGGTTNPTPPKPPEPPAAKVEERPLTKAEQKEFRDLSLKIKAHRESGGPELTTAETQRYEHLTALAGQKDFGFEDGKVSKVEPTSPIAPEGKHSVYEKGGKWLVQMGERRGAGDEIYDTKAGAEARAFQAYKTDVANSEFRAKQAAALKEQKRATDEKEGPLQSYLDTLSLDVMDIGRLKQTLSKQASKATKDKTYTGDRASIVRQMLDDGYSPRTAQVDVVPDASRARFNQMDGREQEAFEKRKREAGKKTQYQLAHPNGSFFDVTKSEYDYAKWVERTKPVEAEPSTGQPKPFPPQLARRLMSLPAESRTYPMGDGNVTLRQDVLEALTGTRPPKAKAGANAVREALAKHFGIDPTKLAGVHVEDAIEAHLQRAAETGTGLKEGEMVKVSIAGPNGPMQITGTVKRIMPDGKVEVKTQLHGYHAVDASEITKPDAEPPAPEIKGMGGAVPSEFAGGGTATSNKNAVVDAERAQRGLPPMMTALKHTWGQAWDEAMARIDADPEYQDKLVTELQRKPRALTDTENAALLHRRVELRNGYDKSTRDASNGYDDAEHATSDEARDSAKARMMEARTQTAYYSDKLQELESATKAAGTESGRSLAARKMMANEDYTLAKMELEARAARGGRPLTDAERAEITELQQKIEQTQKAYDDYRAEADRKIAEAESKTTHAEQLRKAAEEKAPHPSILRVAERIVGELDSRAEAARKRIRERMARTSAGVDPTVLLDVAEIGASHLAHKFLDFAKWSEKMIQDVGDWVKPHLQTVWDMSQTRLDEFADSKAPKAAAGDVKKILRTDPPEVQQEALTERIADKVKKGKKDEIAWYVQKLARTFIMQGVDKLPALIDALHARLVKVLPEITKREVMDMYSGYGDYKQLSSDQISVKMRDLKGQAQQIGKLEDMQAGRAPLKTGVERRSPSDVERRLIAQVNEAKKKGGFVVTDPARQLSTALQARKTYYQNRIKDLQTEIATRKKIVGQKAPVPTDVALERMKAEYERLKEQHEQIFVKPGLTDAQRVERAIKGLEDDIKEYEKRVASKDISPMKQPSSTPSTPALEAVRARRDALRAQLDELRELANPKLTPDQLANKAQKTRLMNQILYYADKLAREDYSRRPTRQRVMDNEALRLDAENERLKKQFHRGLAQQRLAERSKTEKAGDWVVKWRRGFVLSGPVTLAKLTSAAVQRMTFTPAEEAIGGAIGRVFPGVAERAPREGGFNVRAEAHAVTQAMTQGMRDAWQTLRTGQSDLDVKFGKEALVSPAVIDLFGHFHGALKAPTKRAEFARALFKRTDHAIAHGIDVSDPMVQSKLFIESYRDANRAIFQQDNRVVGAYKAALRKLEEKNKETGRVPTVGKAMATTARVLMPIVKIPTNIVAETMQYSAGLVTGSARLARAYYRGIETLKPEEADLIMRQLKKGSIGGAALLLGYLNADVIGGYYQHGEHRKKGDVKPGTARLFGHDIPTFLLHNPLLETLQIGATIRRVADSKLLKKDKDSQGIPAGVGAALLGLVEEVPFVRESIGELPKLFNPQQRSEYFGELGRSLTEPQLLQWTAQHFDTDAEGNPIQRVPKTVGDRLKVGIPGLREEVPKKKK